MRWAESFRDLGLVAMVLIFVFFGITECNQCQRQLDQKRIDCLAAGKSTSECKDLFPK